jgi:hypothetical protein
MSINFHSTDEIQNEVDRISPHVSLGHFCLTTDSEIQFDDICHSVSTYRNLLYVDVDVCDGINDNCWIFYKLKLDKKEFAESILGYCGSGSFPECKSLEDLTTLALALAEEAQKQEMEVKFERKSSKDAFI